MTYILLTQGLQYPAIRSFNQIAKLVNETTEIKVNICRKADAFEYMTMADFMERHYHNRSFSDPLDVLNLISLEMLDSETMRTMFQIPRAVRMHFSHDHMSVIFYRTYGTPKYF